MPDDSPQQLIDALLRDQITTLEKNLNRRLDATEKNVSERFDRQDRELRDIKTQTTATNGRVTVLEKARERGLGVVFAFKWVPWLLGITLSTGTTVLLLVLTGSIK